MLLKAPKDHQEPLLSSARYGLKQSAARLENADSVFRNQVPLAWWLHGDHGIIEWDDDYREVAVDRALERFSASFAIKDPVRIGVIPRCTGYADGCAGVRDIVAGFAETRSNMFRLSDEVCAPC